jgi:hypothetical protein
MQPLTIDLQGVTPGSPQLTDKPVLKAAIEKAINPKRSTLDGAGFNNKL